MKNAINYYYNLNAVDIHQSNKHYRFMVDDNYYCLTPYTRDLGDADSIFELSNNLIQRGIYVHQIIPSNNRNIITVINNIPYIMFKVYIRENDNVTLKDVNYFANYTEGIKGKIPETSNWSIMWANKLDYLEYQISEMGANHPLIRESFSYFVGMGENAIQLFNQINKNATKCISHFRLTGFNNLFDLYNPLNLIIDYKVRDACEYLKYGIFYMNYDFDDIKDYLSFINIKEWPIFMSRMLFPSFYFDIFEEIINNNIGDKRLMTIITKISMYEKLLKQTYAYIRMYTIIPEVEWLQKT